MIDAHCHIKRGEGRHIICEPFVGSTGPNDVIFYGLHPWDYSKWDGGEHLRSALSADSHAGVGEIGLDRLKEREIPLAMREVFLSQLKIASEFRRPVVLHGAKCWGQVVKACKDFAGQIPAFLFHGFSRSGGLISDIKSINGFISVGPAVLNDHAVNYRKLVKEIPDSMLLLESDATQANKDECPSIEEIFAKVAEIRGINHNELHELLVANIEAFLKYIHE